MQIELETTILLSLDALAPAPSSSVRTHLPVYKGRGSTILFPAETFLGNKKQALAVWINERTATSVLGVVEGRNRLAVVDSPLAG